MTVRALMCLLGVLAGLSCDGESPAEDDAAVSDSDEIVGTFNLSLLAPSEADRTGHTALVGKVYDGPSPSQLVWELAMEDGDCQLLVPRAPFCQERCGAGAVCVEDGECENYPTPRSAGKVQVSGVRTTSGETAFSMEPIANTYQPRAAIELPFPAFDEGDRIRLTAAGGEVGPFELEARGIGPLELTTDRFDLGPSSALDLAWIKPEHPGSHVRVKLDISHHGGSKGVIACRFEDDGSAQLPAALVTQLIERGVAGFPSVIVTRESSGQARTRYGRVALVIDSKVERYVTIEGLRSCTGDSECESDETCQPDLTCG